MAMDHEVVGPRLHVRSEAAHGSKCRVGIGRVEEVADPHGLRTHRRDERGAMRNRLVCRAFQPTAQRPRRINRAFTAAAEGAYASVVDGRWTDGRMDEGNHEACECEHASLRHVAAAAIHRRSLDYAKWSPRHTA